MPSNLRHDEVIEAKNNLAQILASKCHVAKYVIYNIVLIIAVRRIDC